MTVTLGGDVFARLVGARGEHVLLFEVARELADELADGWSDPVQVRIVRTEGALVELHLRRVDVAELELEVKARAGCSSAPSSSASADAGRGKSPFAPARPRRGLSCSPH